MINENRLVATFCEMVQIDSPSGEEDEFCKYISEKLLNLGFSVEEDSHGNVIASEEGVNPLILSAHMDTVEPGRGIKPCIVDGIIRSDGDTILGGDCKAGIAAIIESLHSLSEDGTIRIPIQVVLTRGEELGLVGAKNLNMDLIRGKNGVVFDGNGPVNTVTMASPTYTSFEVKIRGKAAHAGVEPENGESAIRIASEIISNLPQGRLDSESTFNVGTIEGGSVRNTVPELAQFTGEFRSRNLETTELLRLQVVDVIEKVKSKYLKSEIYEQLAIEFHRYNLNESDDMVVWTKSVIERIGLKPMLVPSGGGTDANVFNQLGINCVVVGMATNAMHTNEEYVPILDLVNTARFCETLLTE